MAGTLLTEEEWDACFEKAKETYFRLRKEVSSPKEAAIVLLCATGLLHSLNNPTGALHPDSFYQSHAEALREIIEKVTEAVKEEQLQN